MKHLEWKGLIRISVCVFAVYLAVHFLPDVSGFLGDVFAAAAPLFLGVVLAYIINLIYGAYLKILFPRAKRIFWQKARRPLALTLAIISLFALLALVIGLVIPQFVLCIKLLIEKIPALLAATREWIANSAFLSQTLLPLFQKINWQGMMDQAMGLLSSGFDGLIVVLTEVVSGTVTVFIALIFSIYMIWNKTTLFGQIRRLGRNFLSEAKQERLGYLFSTFNNTFRKFLIGQCTEAILLGLLCALGMTILRMPYAVMISAFVSFTALIPIVGAFLGAIVGAVMILTVSPLKALFFLVFIIVLQQIEGNLIYPKVVGSSLGLPAMWVLTAVTMGGALFGVWGMLLGVPLTASLYRIAKHDLAEHEKKMKIDPEPTKEGAE